MRPKDYSQRGGGITLEAKIGRNQSGTRNSLPPGSFGTPSFTVSAKIKFFNSPNVYYTEDMASKICVRKALYLRNHLKIRRS